MNKIDKVFFFTELKEDIDNKLNKFIIISCVRWKESIEWGILVKKS